MKINDYVPANTRIRHLPSMSGHSQLCIIPGYGKLPHFYITCWDVMWTYEQSISLSDKHVTVSISTGVGTKKQPTLLATIGRKEADKRWKELNSKVVCMMESQEASCLMFWPHMIPSYNRTGNLHNGVVWSKQRLCCISYFSFFLFRNEQYILWYESVSNKLIYISFRQTNWSTRSV